MQTAPIHEAVLGLAAWLNTARSHRQHHLVAATGYESLGKVFGSNQGEQEPIGINVEDDCQQVAEACRRDMFLLRGEVRVET